MHYLIEISTGDSKIAGKAIYEYATQHEAVGAFHSKLGTAMKSELYETEILMVVNEFGSVVKSERYDKTTADMVLA